MNSDKFSWADVSVRDWDGSKKFYSELFDWSFIDQFYDGQLVYSLACLDETANPPESTSVAGMGPSMMPEGVSGAMRWHSYINVINLESTVERVNSAGGQITMPPMKVVDAGHMAVCADTKGVAFSLWQQAHGEGAQRLNVPSSVCWFELSSDDPEESSNFYSSVFGWSVEERTMESLEKYWIFSCEGIPTAGMHSQLKITSGRQLWLPYVMVENLSQHVKSCTELGGSVISGSITEPGIGEYAVLADIEQNIFGIAEFSD